MRVGLNILYRIPSLAGGVETYVRRLIDEVIRVDTKNEYVLFVSSTVEMFPLPRRENISVVPCDVDSNNRALRYWWEQAFLPFQVKARSINLLHSMNYVGPVVCPCKTVVTFQDLSYREPSVRMSGARRLGLTLFSGLSALSTDVVVTVSEFSKRSICSSLNVAADRVRVVPSGPGWNSEQPTRAAIEGATRKYRLAGPYVTAFAGGYQHKNIPRLLTAFQTACKDLPHRLVLIGRLAEDVELRPPLVRPEFLDRIQHLGHIPTEEIGPVLAGSELFMFPSLYEGFGFPLLEAQGAGVAVACSKVASIPEVAGAGAVYFDPLSIEDMSAVLRNCLNDPARRQRLAQLGFENVSRFSWTASAKSYVDLYNELGGS
jgi:glycosyltransferase involved in cell wall biosynthesis